MFRGENFNQGPASGPEPVYTPTPATIVGLARAFNLGQDYTLQDVARAWRDSRQLASEPYGEESGNPADLLGIGEDESAVDRWAEATLRGGNETLH